MSSNYKLSEAEPPFVDNLQVSPLQEAAHFRFTSQHCLNKFSCDFLLLFVRQRDIPLLKSQLPLTTKKQHKLHLLN